MLSCFTSKHLASVVHAQEEVEWPQVTLFRQLDDLSSPVHVTHAGDGSQRLFIVEQKGIIRLWKNGSVVDTPFLDMTDRVRKFDEKGLLSIAFPPAYAQKQYFYVDYSDNNGKTVIARYHVGDNPDVADPASEEVLLRIDQPTGDHNGGQLAFGPDGYLYISVGDGGPDNDPDNRAQNLSLLLGKILRIDVEHGEPPYAIPPTNPYKDMVDHRPEIWSHGLRNPWRFSFDRQTGDLYIGDVGNSLYEEINFQPAAHLGGADYGWRCTEGAHEFDGHLSECTGNTITLPVAEYSHELGCSVTGGTVYRGALYPRLQGLYFYADFCTGRIWGLKREGNQWQHQLLLETSIPIASFGEGDDGEVYVVNYIGSIYRLADAEAPSTAELHGAWTRAEQTCTTTDGEQRCIVHGVFPVQNRGPSRTSRSFLTKFYLSDDATFDDSDILLKAQRAGSLRPGKAVRFTWGKTLPGGGSASGRYLLAVVDAEQTVEELNEDNNLVVFGPIP
jgi:glucose/arabinose dehydrogenase